jgi:phosphoglycerol transferase MdoB-like AlkP superfamily enzyme
LNFFTNNNNNKKKTTTKNKKPPNILLIHLESFRSLEMGVLGGKKIKQKTKQSVTPFLDELAKTGILFTNHYTPAVQTSRTLLTSLFGILPSLTEETAVSQFSQTKTRFFGLPQILKQTKNYTNIFWSAVNFAWEDWDFFLKQNGFDFLFDDKKIIHTLKKKKNKIKEEEKEEDSFSWGYHDPLSFQALEYFLQEKKQQQQESQQEGQEGQPLFIDMYTISSHDPWSIPASFFQSLTMNLSAFYTQYNKKYIDSLHFTDHALGTFIQNLRQKGLMNNTIVIIEGDHGFGRMEHGDNPTMVASGVYDVGSHVPLIILADDFLPEKQKGKIIEDLTVQTDLMATICDILGIENFMQHGIGQSMMRQEHPQYPRRTVLENPYYGITTGLRIGKELKYIFENSGNFRLFNLTSDPKELAPIEQGMLTDTKQNIHSTTLNAYAYTQRVLDLFSYMYTTNGFMPSIEKETTTTTKTTSKSTG